MRAWIQSATREIPMTIIRLTQSVIAVMVASAVLKFGNENYEMLKAEGGVALPALCLPGGIALGIYGYRRFLKSMERCFNRIVHRGLAFRYR